MRPPFRSVSFPCLRQWGACCPPRVAKTLQRDCTSLRPSCWPLDLVGKCSLAPLARPWLGRLAPLASLRLSLAPLVLGSGFACLGYAPPERFEAFDLRTQFRSLRSFVSPFYSENKSGIFEKKERSGERPFFPKMAYLVFVPPTLHKNKICKKVLYITRSYGSFLIPPPLATGNAP